jgi:uncharacterized protein YciW
MTDTLAKDHIRPDAIDRAAGLEPGMPVYGVRDLRPEFLAGAEACRMGVLAPADDLGLSPGLRMAIARRVARTSDNERIVAAYPQPELPMLAELADGGDPSDPFLAAIAAHADMIGSDPGRASAGDLQRLLDAGLTVPQVIALSELLAYVCFQIRIVHGLSLLKETA